MCAITGIFAAAANASISRTLLAAMNDCQAHRGPDQSGLHLEPGLGLGHRRLSIIDLAGGIQPLFNEDRSVVVVYNGEIYNFAALAEELARAGHRFRTHCDTEVIVHAWEEWGANCLERFRGMFAFALWDRKAATLFLARDRLGIKPLYYAELTDGTLLFASELKALERHPRLPRELDPEAVEDYFTFGYIPEPRSIFQAVRKLAPGHYLLRQRGAPTASPRCYWDLPQGDPWPGSEAALGEELITRLREAVQLRLIADVPVGAFLSGGVDSSAVVAMMSQLQSATDSAPVATCSIAFGHPAFDESSHAAAVAERYRTRHLVERVDADQFALLPRLAAIYDEPFADSSALPTYLVCALARKRVTVALSGDGGDEGLAGYRRYQWHLSEERLRVLLPHWLRRPLFSPLGHLYPALPRAPRVLRARATLRALARDTVAGYTHLVSLLETPTRHRLYSQEFRRRLAGYEGLEVMRGHAARWAGDDSLGLVQYLDYKTYLPGDILTKVDRASMAHGLEVRVPLLDHLLVGWMARVPRSLKLRGSEGKYLLKRALEPYLPRAVLYRPKAGFAVPVADWFRGPLRDDLRMALQQPQLLDSGIFDPTALHRLMAAHQAGDRDYSAALWSLLMFSAFLTRVAGPVPTTAPG